MLNNPVTQDKYIIKGQQANNAGSLLAISNMQVRKPSEDHSKVSNYLAYARSQRESNPNLRIKKPSYNTNSAYNDNPLENSGSLNNLDKYLKNPDLTEFERLSAVKTRADLLEAKAKMMEQKFMLAASQGGTGSQGNLDAVNDMYIENIQQKLNILDKI